MIHHFRKAVALSLAFMLCSVTAWAFADTGVRVFLPGETNPIEPVFIQTSNIDGTQFCRKTYEVPPEFDPAELKEADFILDGYCYTYHDMRKKEELYTNSKTISETVTMDSPKKDLASVLQQFPSTRSYDKDGYTGTLLLDANSIKTEATGYTTHQNSHPHSVTKTYQLTRNDRSLVPESIQADGLTLPRVSLNFTRNSNVPESDVPGAWTATATYSKTTYSTSKTANGYRSTAVYFGTVSTSGVQSVRYTVTYTGMKMPILPFLPPFITWPWFIVAVSLLCILIIVLTLWLISSHIARVYVLDETTRLNTIISRQYVKIKNPFVCLTPIKGCEQAEYIIVLSRRLAKRLVGKEISVKTGGDAQCHKVATYLGKQPYSFIIIL